jgi:pimeloyl-ACP methyl ester carboxylesterase
MKKVILKNSKFSYIRKGQEGKPKMLMLHPFLSSYEYYIQTMDYLKEDFDIIALDIPGFGRSRLFRGEEYSLANIADLIVKFCDKLRFKPFHIVGSSLGGMISTIITANYPEYVVKAVLHATPINSDCINNTYQSNILELTSKNKNLINKIQKLKKGVDEELMMSFVSAISQEYKEIEQKKDVLYLGIKYIDFKSASKILKSIKDTDLTFYLKSIKKAVLVTIGNNDITTYLKCKKKMFKLLKNAKFELVESGVHPIFLQKPLIMAGVIRKFINEKSNS